MTEYLFFRKVAANQLLGSAKPGHLLPGDLAAEKAVEGYQAECSC